MPHRRWKLDIFPRGAVSTTGAASYTISSSHFRDAPTVGGQVVRAAESRVESMPWRVTVVDVGSTFTAKIANSSGRLHLLGRLARLRSALNSTASTAFSSVSVGRLTDLALAPDVASWDLDISDERWVERQTSIFTKSNTISIVPYISINAFQGMPAPARQKWRVMTVTGNVVCLRYDGVFPVPTSPGLVQLIVDDVKSDAIPGNTAVTAGNFTHLRFQNTGNTTDYEIAAFGAIIPISSPTSPIYPNDLLGFWDDPLLGVTGERDTPREKLYVWLVWAASQPSVGSDVRGYLYAPTHEPTIDLPQLVGGSSGLHPGALVREVYAGTHSATTGLTVRASTAALNTWENDPSYGRVWFTLTAPVRMSDFLDERIYGPYNVAPVVDSSGKIAPVSLGLPYSTQINVAGLAVLTSTNLLSHPTWEHPSKDVVNVLRYTHERYGNIFSVEGGGARASILRPTTMSSTRMHDTSTIFGRRELTFRLGSVEYHRPPPAAGLPATPIGTNVSGLIDRLAYGMFQRFGDGPVYSHVDCTSSIDATTNGAILPGRFVKLRLGTYPNANTLARGSTRILQVMQRDVTPVGRGLMLLDAGANLTPLTAPAIALALSTMSSRHALVGTVSSLPAGARYETQVAHSSSTGTTTAPGSTSNRWFTGAVGTSTGLAFTLGNRPSKTRMFARVRATKPLRIGSAWSTANVTAVTASITAPSGLAVSSITAGSAVMKWTYGSSSYGAEILVDATSTATLGSTHIIDTVPPRTTQYTLRGLNSNDGHKVAVRHLDQFGGRSAQDTTTFTTTTSFTAAPAMRGIVVVIGGV